MARSKSTPKTNRVTVSLDDKAYAALQAFGQRDDVSISWLIRRAISEMLEKQEKQRSKRGPSSGPKGN